MTSKEGFSAVAREKIWKEHLEKCNVVHRKMMAQKHVFAANPFRMLHEKPLSEPINKRESRFLDRNKAALDAVTKKLEHPPLTLPPLPVAPTASLPASCPATVRQEDELRMEKLLDAVHKPPVEKYKFPMTAAQEFGWLNRPLVKQDRRFVHPLKSCDVTRVSTFVKTS